MALRRLLRVASTVGKLILAKMWLFVHRPRLLSENNTQAVRDLKDKVFLTSVEVVESSTLLEKEQSTRHWAWLFKTCIQWQSVVYVISELGNKDVGPDFDRAWNAIDDFRDSHMLDHNKGRKEVVWHVSSQLCQKALRRRVQIGSQEDSATRPQNNSDASPSEGGHHSMISPVNAVLTANRPEENFLPETTSAAAATNTDIAMGFSNAGCGCGGDLLGTYNTGRDFLNPASMNDTYQSC